MCLRERREIIVYETEMVCVREIVCVCVRVTESICVCVVGSEVIWAEGCSAHPNRWSHSGRDRLGGGGGEREGGRDQAAKDSDRGVRWAGDRPAAGGGEQLERAPRDSWRIEELKKEGPDVVHLWRGRGSPTHTSLIGGPRGGP